MSNAGQLVVPKDGDETHHSIIMQIDPRTKLYVDKSQQGHDHSQIATSTVFPGTDAGARATGDVCMMASKLAYENEAVVKQVVTSDWKVIMHLLRTMLSLLNIRITSDFGQLITTEGKMG